MLVHINHLIIILIIAFSNYFYVMNMLHLSVSPVKDMLESGAVDVKTDGGGDLSTTVDQEDHEEEEFDEEEQKMDISDGNADAPSISNLSNAAGNEEKKDKASKKSSTIVAPENQLAINRSRRVIEPRRGIVYLFTVFISLKCLHRNHQHSYPDEFYMQTQDLKLFQVHTPPLISNWPK